MTTPPVPPVAPPPGVIARWQAILTALVLLGAGISTSFSLNLDKNALLSLVPGAAFLAAAVVTAVHSHGAHRVTIAQIQAGRSLLAPTIYTTTGNVGTTPGINITYPVGRVDTPQPVPDVVQEEEPVVPTGPVSATDVVTVGPTSGGVG